MLKPSTCLPGSARLCAREGGQRRRGRDGASGDYLAGANIARFQQVAEAMLAHDVI
jgi:hypothetical protein